MRPSRLRITTGGGGGFKSGWAIGSNSIIGVYVMKKNVASQVIGAAMVSATDGSAFTGSVTVYVTGNGGAQAVGSVGAGACTHEGNGFHTYAPAQAETNYDHIGFTFIGTGAVPATVQVFPTFPQTGDSFARIGAPAGASIAADIATVDTVVDSILVDTAEIGAAGAGLTAVPWNAAWDAQVESEVTDALNAYDPPTKTELDTGLSALATAANLATVAGYLDTEIAAILADTNELQTDWANGGRLDLILDARASQSSVDVIDGIVDSILVDTAEIGAAGAGLTAVPWNASWDAQVESEVTDALNAYDPPTKAELDSAVAPLATAANLATVAGYLDTEIAAILEDTGTTLPAAIAALNDLDAGEVATAVWNAATATYGSAGSYGLLVETNLDAPVSVVDTVVDSIKLDTAAILVDTADMQPKLGTPAGASISADIAAIEAQTDDIGAAGAGLTAVPWNPSWDAEVQSEVADALVAFWTTPGTLVDLIWDEAIAGHAGAGSTGEALAGATAPTAAAVADAVWDEALSGHLSAGSTGEALNAAGAAGDPWTTTLPGAYTGSQAGKMLSDIITDTAEIGAAGTGLTAVPWNASWDAQVESEVTDALNAYDPPTNAEMVAAIPTATQNADALLNRDMSAVSDTNARSPLNALRLLRNKWTSSGGTLTVTKEDDTTSAWTATLTGDAAADPVVGSDPA